MNTVAIKNDTGASIRILSEPWANSYDLHPAETIEFSRKFDGIEEVVQINIHKDSINIWVPNDVEVTKQGKHISPL